MKVLVTGGTGFLGKRLSLVKPDWIYVSSSECDLRSYDSTKDLLNSYKPDAVLHLAGRVGGIKDNKENQAVFFDDNVLMNTNVIRASNEVGIERVLSSLSTCAFPNEVDRYPFVEEDLFEGPPAKTNFSYGFSKRMLHVQSMSYREQYGRNYSTFCPSNLYGPGDHYDSEKSHFVPAIISKVARSFDGDTIELWGTGKPLRQQLYVDDLCLIIPILLEKHNTDSPLIVAPPENLSILEMAEKVVAYSEKRVKLIFNGKLDGQLRKDGSNKRMMNLVNDFKFTSFDKGVKKAYKWYLENK